MTHDQLPRQFSLANNDRLRECLRLAALGIAPQQENSRFHRQAVKLTLDQITQHFHALFDINYLPETYLLQAQAFADTINETNLNFSGAIDIPGMEILKFIEQLNTQLQPLPSIRNLRQFKEEMEIFLNQDIFIRRKAQNVHALKVRLLLKYFRYGDDNDLAVHLIRDRQFQDDNVFMARLAFDPHLDEYEKQLYHAHYLELKNLHRLLLKWETGIGVVENKAKLSTWISDLLFLCNRKLVVNRQSGGCFSMHRAPYCLYYFLVSLYYRGRKPGLGPKSARK